MAFFNLNRRKFPLLLSIVVIVFVNSCQIQHSKKLDISNFTLQPFTEIKGVGAASGLIHQDSNLYIISDDSDVLYEYQLKKKQLNKISLRSDQQILESIKKKKKSDFEAIAFDGMFHIFGSGSSSNRNQRSTFSKTKNKLEVKSLEKLYQLCKTSAKIRDEDFNIEGALIKNKTLLLFNRGNGPEQKNGIFRIENWLENNIKTPVFYPNPLPTIENTAFGFTDAIQVDDKIYFLAAAEVVTSTYHDGEILGSMLGVIDFKTLTLEKTQIISNHQKFEGITHFQSERNSKTFLLCEDPDNGTAETVIYELAFSK